MGMPAVRIDRVTLIVSDLDQAEDDYVTTFGCSVEHRDAIEHSLTSVLAIPAVTGRRSLLQLGRADRTPGVRLRDGTPLPR